MTKIKTIKQLRALTSKKSKQFKLLLVLGLFSLKTIKWNEKLKLFSIKNHIDGTREKLSEKDLKKTPMGRAMTKGNFITA